MCLDFLVTLFEQHVDAVALIWNDQSYSYQWLLDRVLYWLDRLSQEKILSGTIVVLYADFSPNSVALFLALIRHQCIIVPLAISTVAVDKQVALAQGEVMISIDSVDQVQVDHLSISAKHDLYDQLRQVRHPGLVLFSSGSTGQVKAIVHDLALLVEKKLIKRRSLRTVLFLLYDHIGGINTMLYVLSNVGCMVCLRNRSPDKVLRAIEKYHIELLPTSPTFINLILLSEAYKRYDLRSLKVITYGTEPMLESTLVRCQKLFPHVKLQQTYGLSEVGILRSKSKNSDSVWLKVGGDGFQTRIVNNMLQIKAYSAMLGYLNAPSPFTEEGWLETGDLVESDGDYIRILGRQSEIINVGGEKVYPVEVENIIFSFDNVADVIVYGEKNLLVGNIVCAHVCLRQSEDKRAFIMRLKKFCQDKLQDYKIPIKVFISDKQLYTNRFKKDRGRYIQSCTK
ncbi:MAG: fatty acid--CoA ligase family protein [Pseudomonadota bacterium]